MIQKGGDCTGLSALCVVFPTPSCPKRARTETRAVTKTRVTGRVFCNLPLARPASRVEKQRGPRRSSSMVYLFMSSPVSYSPLTMKPAPATLLSVPQLQSRPVTIAEGRSGAHTTSMFLQVTAG